MLKPNTLLQLFLGDEFDLMSWVMNQKENIISKDQT